MLRTPTILYLSRYSVMCIPIQHLEGRINKPLDTIGPVLLSFDLLATLQSDLARQSLYVKFDPLVEARKPDIKPQGT